MQKILSLATIAFISLCSCNNAPESKPAATDTAKAAPMLKPKPVFSYPIQRKDWELGDPANINTALAFYKAWDDKKLDGISNLFSDTVIMRIPAEKTEIKVSKEKMNDMLAKNLSGYQSTTNTILSAVSLHDNESGEDWVMITTYSKWIEKTGKRDSVLYHDDWKFKDGKISFLLSFDKVPTKEFLTKNDPKKP